jgi:septum formation topological specificity factor MinE
MKETAVNVVKTVTTTVTERVTLSRNEIFDLIRKHTGLDGAKVEFEFDEHEGTGEFDRVTVERTWTTAGEG